MANYTINSTATISTLGDVDIYIGGKTSTTLIDTKILDLSDISYDFSSINGVFSGQMTILLANYDLNVSSQNANINTQVWIIEVGGTEYFRGLPLKSSIVYETSSSQRTGKFTLVADFLDPTGVDFSGLSSLDSLYSLSDVLEAILLDKSGVSTVNYLNSSTELVYSLTEADTIDVYFDYDDAGASDGYIAVADDASFNPLQITNDFALNYAFYKGEAYFWLIGSFDSTVAIDEGQIVGKMSYYPSSINSDAYETLRLGLNIRDTDLSSSGIWSAHTLPFLEVDDQFNQFNSTTFAASNWAKISGSSGEILDAADDSAFFFGEGRKAIVSSGLYNASSVSLGLELAEADFENDPSDYKALTVSLNCGIKFPTINYRVSGAVKLDYIYSIELSFSMVGDDSQLSFLLEESEDFDYSLEGVYNFSTVGDLQISLENISGNIANMSQETFALAPAGATIFYDNVGLVTKINYADSLECDYVFVSCPSLPAFDGTYRIVSRFDDGSQVVHTLDVVNTTSTTPTACDVFLDYAIYINNLSIGILGANRKELIDYAVDETKPLAPTYIDGTGMGAVTATNSTTRELQNLIAIESVSQYDAYWGQETLDRLIFSTTQEIEPTDKLTLDGKSYLVKKHAFDIKTGLTKITADLIA